MKAASVLPVAIITISIALIAVLPLIDLTLLARFMLPPCPHVTLVSAPRHGSTWFLDSVEGCTSFETEKQNYRELIVASELWTSHEGPVYNISAEEAADYVMTKCSVKLFPPLQRRGTARVTEFLTLVKERDVPVFVLRRSSQNAYESLADAMENKAWAKNTGGQTERNVELTSGKDYDRYQKKLDLYFEEVQKMMWDLGIKWDEVHYEDIKDQRDIVGRQNGCVIRNCNFM